MNWNDTTKISRLKTIPWQFLDGRVVILNSVKGKAHELNETASWVWQKIEKEQSFSSLLNSFYQEFDADKERLRKDLVVLLDELKSFELLNMET